MLKNFFLLLCFPWVAFGQPFAFLDKGKSAFDQGDYPRAVQIYADKKPSCVQHYNLGTSLYKQNNWQKALEQLNLALPQAEPALQQKIYYNTGNTQYRLGEALQAKDPTATIAHWKHALSAYESSLALDPKGEDAQFNRDFVQKKLDNLEQEQKEKEQEKEQEEKKDNPEDKDQDKQDNSKDKKDDPGDKNEDKKGQDKKDEPSKGQDPQQDKDKKPQQPKENPEPKEPEPSKENPEPKESPKDQEAPEPKPGSLSLQEAARILDAGAKGEKQLPLVFPENQKREDTMFLEKSW